MSRRFSTIKEGIVFSRQPWKAGMGAIQLSGLAKRTRRKASPASSQGEKASHAGFFLSPYENVKQTSSCISVLYRYFLCVKNSLSTDCKHVCADLSRPRPATAFTSAGTVRLQTTLLLITTVFRLLALKINIKPLTWHLFSIMFQLCLTFNKIHWRPLSHDEGCFPHQRLSRN